VTGPSGGPLRVPDPDVAEPTALTDTHLFVAADPATGAVEGLPLPGPVRTLLRSLPGQTGADFSRFVPPSTGTRASAVLILLAGPTADEPEPTVLLIERAATLRQHAGQPAFPGGRVDPEDAGPVAAALREAAEEVGVDPAGVRVLATLPALWVPVSASAVTPVVAWWDRESPVGVVDTAEVARVARVSLRTLADPECRWRVRHPRGYVGPAFDVHGMLVWGFTAGLLDRVLALCGLTLPWDTERFRALPL
jgi:8-oxo-dGTP pyrophosphatase MutT (NUDIX family)